MQKTRIFSLVLLFTCLSLVGGCATNQFAKYYQDGTTNMPPEVAKRLMPYSGNSKIFTTNDMKSDSETLMRQGYRQIGSSGFHGTGRVTQKQLQDQATNVGADVVLYASRYQGSEQVAKPFLQYNPGQTSTTYSSGNVNANAYGSGGYAHGTATYSGTSDTTTSGTYSTTVVPVTVHRYQYGATFWRKSKPSTLGVLFVNLPDELRKNLQRNTGVLVMLVIDDSPAFKANILPGDVITEMSGIAIESQKDFMAKIPQFEGKKCDLLILRNGKPITISVQMGTRPDN
jgi:hypothetical protein